MTKEPFLSRESPKSNAQVFDELCFPLFLSTLGSPPTSPQRTPPQKEPSSLRHAAWRYLMTRDGTRKSNVSAPPIPNAKLTTARPRAVIENVSRQHLLARQVPILQQPMLILFCIYFVQPILSALRSRKTLASLLRCIILAEVASGFAHGDQSSERSCLFRCGERPTGNIYAIGHLSHRA
jgi:hypothetical protein